MARRVSVMCAATVLVGELMVGGGGAAAASPAVSPSAVVPVNPMNVGSAVSIPFSKSVPALPESVSGYRLKGQKVRADARLFEGAKWEALPPLDHGSAGHCDTAAWVVRWRSRNPDVTMAAAVGDTALPGFNRPGKSSVGGAGYITGNACVSPGLKFAQAINGNGSNLADVDYEYQIWVPTRDI